MSTTEQGRAAEAVAAKFLEARGLRILARNWRTRWHEVDIVAQSPAGLHFVEVKYRRSHAFGTGFEHISADKVQRLQRAALYWIQINGYDGDCQIDAISITGALTSAKVEYLESISI